MKNLYIYLIQRYEHIYFSTQINTILFSDLNKISTIYLPT